MSKNLQVNCEADTIQFNEYYKIYYNQIRGYIYSKVKDNEVSDEIVQNTFLKLLNNMKSNKMSNIKGWLYTVAHNECIDFLKKNSRAIYSLEEQYFEPFTEKTPQDVVQEGVDKKIIIEILTKLQKNQRAVILLKDVRGYTYKEIAKEMGISYQAVKSLIFRGRQNFIKYYREVEGNEM